jgi:hypothetical protein
VTNDDVKSRPETLAGYVDGELTPSERLAVETWLADHPEARADVEGQRRLERAWQSTRPSEPDAGTWVAALEGIKARLPATPFPPHRRLPLRWLVGLAATVAAAIALYLANRTPPDVFPAASAEDVEITSLSDTDADDVLLVGFAPVSEPMLLASEGEITLDELKPEPGMHPRYYEDPGAPPMIVPADDEKHP